MESGIIAGGGIAGLTTAIALQKFGLKAAVYEAAPEIKPLGAGIWMAPNAMQVFDRLGIAGKIMDAGVPLQKIQVVDEKMQPILQTRQEKIREKFGFTTTAIRRSSLQAILMQELDQIPLLLDKTVAAVTEQEDNVAVTFADGSQASGRYLIGADGIHSAVRDTYFKPADLRTSGHVCWRGVAELQLQPRFKKAIIEGWKDGLRFGFSEVGDGQVDWFAVKKLPLKDLPENASLKENLLEWFGAFDYPVRDILAATKPDRIIINEIADFKTLDRWDKGNVCLIGDAAHASTPYMGQGGCQAIEDAYVLAKCLSEATTPAAAFRELQRHRKTKAKFIVNNSRMMGHIGYLSGLPALVRNACIRATPLAVTEYQFCQVYKLGF